jgi:hypothetical protein
LQESVLCPTSAHYSVGKSWASNPDGSDVLHAVGKTNNLAAGEVRGAWVVWLLLPVAVRCDSPTCAAADPRFVCFCHPTPTCLQCWDDCAWNGAAYNGTAEDVHMAIEHTQFKDWVQDIKNIFQHDLWATEFDKGRCLGPG